MVRHSETNGIKRSKQGTKERPLGWWIPHRNSSDRPETDSRKAVGQRRRGRPALGWSSFGSSRAYVNEK